MSDPILVGDAVVGDPVLVALVTIIPTIVLGLLGYRRATRLDKIAAASAGRPNGGQQLIDHLLAENAELRAENARLRAG